ncbi:MAG: hypothetical protein WCR45_00745 [Bacteroidaceae bacterium]|nr:hypothetical protein [Bacteroidaceae bacterium]
MEKKVIDLITDEQFIRSVFDDSPEDIYYEKLISEDSVSQEIIDEARQLLLHLEDEPSKLSIKEKDDLKNHILHTLFEH